MDLTSLLRTEAANAMAASLAIGILLLAARPKDRASTRNALLLLGLGAAAAIAAAVLAKADMPRAAGMTSRLTHSGSPIGSTLSSTCRAARKLSATLETQAPSDSET